MRAVRAVRALTRFHYAGAGRRTFSRDAARDRRATASWGWHENVVGLGVSWKREKGARTPFALCVTFFVLRKEPARRLLRRQRIPECLELDSVDAGVLTDVVQVPGRCVAHAGVRVRPIRPGAEVGHMRGGRGTLGPIVQKIGDTRPLALSCSHVIARSGAIEDFGRKIEQPAGDNISDIVGSLVEFSVLRSGTLVTADVALAALSVDADPAVLGSTIVPAAASAGSATEFEVGMRTVLFGQVSNGARGEVEAFESTWDIDEMPFVNGRVEFSGLVAYRTRCAKGDSGGLVMSGKTGEESLVHGIHTAGRADGRMGLFQPIGPILTRFDLRLLATLRQGSGSSRARSRDDREIAGPSWSGRGGAPPAPTRLRADGTEDSAEVV